MAKYKTEGFVNVIDPQYESLYYKKYHIDITPELYIMDANNKIIAKDLHPNQIEPIPANYSPSDFKIRDYKGNLINLNKPAKAFGTRSTPTADSPGMLYVERVEQ